MSASPDHPSNRGDVVDLVLVPAPAARPVPVAPAPAPIPTAPKLWPWWVRVGRTVCVTAAALVATAALSVHAISTPDAPTAKWSLAVDDLSADPDHRWVSHAAVNPTYPTLLLWAVGLLVFGVCVERSCGTVRTIGVFLAGAVGGVLGQSVFNTPAGQQALGTELAKVYWNIAEARGLAAADAFAEGAVWVCQQCQHGGLVGGSAGVVAALIAYAAFRRDMTGDALTVRPLKFLLAAAYVVPLVWWVWPKWVGEPFPWAVFVGGFAGGLAMIVPDKVLGWVWEKVCERFRNGWQVG